MCGRFVMHSSLRLIEKTFNVDAVACEVASNYNVAPTQEVLVITRNHHTRLDKYCWGLVPFWAKDVSIGSKLINARAETVAQKPSFRNAFKNRRCLIIADGFYEWQGEKGHKRPWYLTLPSGEPFAFAGLWEIWRSGAEDEYRSCAIITTAANESIRDIHNRMPVILQPAIYDAWLNPQNHDIKQLSSILQNEFIRELARYPVSRRVNDVRHNDARCIQPLDSDQA